MRDAPLELNAALDRCDLGRDRIRTAAPVAERRCVMHLSREHAAYPLEAPRHVRGRTAAERRTSTDVQHGVFRAAIEHLILEGECLQEEGPTRDTVAAWIDRARASLTGVFGLGHRFVVDVQQAADGAAHPASDAGLTTARYLRVLILVVLAALRRATSELQMYARP